jgi:hypothetical protein
MPTAVDVPPEFNALIQKLQSLSSKLADAEQNGGASLWMVPAISPSSSPWPGDVTDYVNMVKLFDRSSSNQQYIDITTAAKPGSQGDAQVLQTVIDYTATMQRAFLQRHTSNKARAFAHAATRKRGHGLDYGTFGLAVLQQLQQLVAIGKSEPQS